MTWTKVANVGAVKTGRKCCSTATKESVTSMGRLPCHGATWGVVDQPKLPKPGEEAAYFCAGGRRKGPPKSAKLELSVQAEDGGGDGFRQHIRDRLARGDLPQVRSTIRSEAQTMLSLPHALV